MCLCSTIGHSQDKKFYLGIQSGIFVPSNEFIDGYQIITYNDGSPTGLQASGYGNATDLNLRFQYYISNFGIHFDGGARIFSRAISMSLAPDGTMETYENTLNIFPIEFGVVYRYVSKNEKVVPYYSVGIGGYYGTMNALHEIENTGRDWYKGSSFAMGFYHSLGMYMEIYGDLLLNAEIKFNHASSDWHLENQDVNREQKYEKLNTGGAAYKVGLAFRF